MRLIGVAGMTEKAKRKNDDPIPRHYRWIFGMLAIVLLISLRFPIQILYRWELNPLLYALITFGCFVSLLYFILRHHWKRRVVALVLICMLLSGLHTMVYNLINALSMSDRPCLVFEDNLITKVTCCTDTYSYTEYISIADLPIAILIDNGRIICGRMMEEAIRAQE